MRLIDKDEVMKSLSITEECEDCPFCSEEIFCGKQQDFVDACEAIYNAPVVEIIHCKDCIYYDPEHVEKNGVRYEYGDMPKDAFDILGTDLVTSKYGINVGGRCCRDYNVGYPEDKRVFVSEQNAAELYRCLRGDL